MGWGVLKRRQGGVCVSVCVYVHVRHTQTDWKTKGHSAFLPSVPGLQPVDTLVPPPPAPESPELTIRDQWDICWPCQTCNTRPKYVLVYSNIMSAH